MKREKRVDVVSYVLGVRRDKSGVKCLGVSWVVLRCRGSWVVEDGSEVVSSSSSCQSQRRRFQSAEAAGSVSLSAWLRRGPSRHPSLPVPCLHLHFQTIIHFPVTFIIICCLLLPNNNNNPHGLAWAAFNIYIATPSPNNQLHKHHNALGHFTRLGHAQPAYVEIHPAGSKRSAIMDRGHPRPLITVRRSSGRSQGWHRAL